MDIDLNLKRIINIYNSSIGKQYHADQSLDFTKRDLHTIPQTGRKISDDIKKIFSYLPNNFPYILDVGCGLGMVSHLLHLVTGKPVIGIDCSDATITKAKEISLSPNVSFHKYTLGTNSPVNFQDNPVIFSRMFLIHIPDSAYEEIIRELLKFNPSYLAFIEYFSQKNESLDWRGVNNMIYKRDNYKQISRLVNCKKLYCELIQIREEFYNKKDLYYQHCLIELNK